MGLITDAYQRANERDATRRPIDYDRMKQVWPRQKAALTRAVNTGDPEKVAKVCKDAIEVWNEIGAWPDDWALFQRGLDDVLPYYARVDINDL